MHADAPDPNGPPTQPLVAEGAGGMAGRRPTQKPLFAGELAHCQGSFLDAQQITHSTIAMQPSMKSMQQPCRRNSVSGLTTKRPTSRFPPGRVDIEPGARDTLTSLAPSPRSRHVLLNESKRDCRVPPALQAKGAEYIGQAPWLISQLVQVGRSCARCPTMPLGSTMCWEDVGPAMPIRARGLH